MVLAKDYGMKKDQVFESPVLPPRRASEVISTALFGLSLTLGIWAPLWVDGGELLPLGEQLPDVTLVDTRGAPMALNDLVGVPALAVVFVDASCAAVAEESAYLEDLWQRLRREGMVLVGVNSNRLESAFDAAVSARERGWTFPVLMDFDQVCRDLLGARRSPHAFVFDAQGKLRYRGAVRTASSTTPSRLLERAVSALLAGRELSVGVTAAPGCLIRAPQRRRGRGREYHQHVAPILAARCTRCHSPAGQAFDLTNFAAASRRAGALRRVVSQRRMPPVFGSGPAVELQKQLTRKELATLVAWVGAGTPEGAPPAESVPPGASVSAGGSASGKANSSIVFTAARAAAVRPLLPRSGGGGGGLASRSLSLVPPVPADVWVAGFTLKAPAAVRGVLLSVVTGGDDAGQVVAAFGPGCWSTPWEPGRGMQLPVGAHLRARIIEIVDLDATAASHSAAAPEVTAFELTARRSEAALKPQRTAALTVGELKLDPGAFARTVRITHRLDRAAAVRVATPWLGRYATSLAMRVVPPPGDDGSPQPAELLSVPSYSPAWPLSYSFSADSELLVAGTVIEATIVFDNSRLNQYAIAPEKAWRMDPSRSLVGVHLVLSEPVDR